MPDNEVPVLGCIKSEPDNTTIANIKAVPNYVNSYNNGIKTEVDLKYVKEGEDRTIKHEEIYIKEEIEVNETHDTFSVETTTTTKHIWGVPVVKPVNNILDNNIYKCNVICQFESLYKSGFRKDVGIHKEKPFICQICEYKCSRKNDLAKHIRIHTGEKPFVCQICKYKCSQNSSLARHMKIHTGEKPFVCELCEYKCSVRSNFANHMKTHTRKMPFVCQICEYKCSRKKDLAKHIRIHTGEKPFICQICNYKCSQKSSLARHLKIHTGEKPFACELCEYKCSVKSNLANHMKIHIREMSTM